MICKPVCKANMENLIKEQYIQSTKNNREKTAHNIVMFFCCSFTWYLERGTLSRTPGRACRRNKRPPHLFPQMQKVLWFCKGSSPPSHLSPQTYGNREAQVKLQTVFILELNLNNLPFVFWELFWGPDSGVLLDNFQVFHACFLTSLHFQYIYILPVVEG